MKATQLKKTRSAAATFFKKTESVHNVPPYNIKSHQPLYSEKILTQKISENWEGFNSWIKAWQNQRGYEKLNSKVYSKRPVKNPKIPEDLLKAE